MREPRAVAERDRYRRIARSREVVGEELIKEGGARREPETPLTGATTSTAPSLAALRIPSREMVARPGLDDCQTEGLVTSAVDWSL